jgi:hypothetical protein
MTLKDEDTSLSSPSPQKSRMLPSTRLAVSFLCFLLLFEMYMLRVNISMALVCMVRTKHAISTTHSDTLFNSTVRADDATTNQSSTSLCRGNATDGNDPMSNDTCSRNALNMNEVSSYFYTCTAKFQFDLVYSVMQLNKTSSPHALGNSFSSSTSGLHKKRVLSTGKALLNIFMPSSLLTSVIHHCTPHQLRFAFCVSPPLCLTFSWIN